MTREKALDILASMMAREMAEAKSAAQELPSLGELCNASIMKLQEVAAALDLTNAVEAKFNKYWRL